MAEKRPLVLNDGQISEIPIGDTLPPDTYTGGAGSPDGDLGKIQYNDAGAFGGAANVEIQDGDIVFGENATPTNPTLGKVKLFAKKIANRVFPTFVGVSGMDACLQPSLWRQKIGMWSAVGSGTLVTAWNTLAATTVGTATSRAIATTNLLTRVRRIGYVSATTAASFSEWRFATAQFTTGNGAGLGGFFKSFRFAITDAAAVAGARFFCGMSSNVAAATNVEPDTLTNVVGIAQISTDNTQLYLVYGGSAAQTKIALGTNFPPMQGVGATNGVFYDLSIFAPPSSNGQIGIRLERVGTSFFYETVLTPATPGVQTPLSTTLLAPRMWRTNNATALAVGIDVSTVYHETDY